MLAKRTSFTACPLDILYDGTRNKAIPEEELMQRNITSIFWNDCDVRLQSKELINIQVYGKPTSGKSTAGGTITWEILKKMKQKMTVKNNIVSDQTEFLRFVTKRIKNTFLMIDEWNVMASSGENATTEQNLMDQYSNIFAQDYIHRVLCAPTIIADTNTYLLLEARYKDMKKKITCCRAIYNDGANGIRTLLGRVEIDVSKFIKTKVHEEYRKKKEKRMALLTDNGVPDIRELEFAYIALKVYQRLKGLARDRKVMDNLVLGTIDEVLRDEKRIYTMITKIKILRMVQVPLSLVFSARKDEGKLLRIKNETRQGLGHNGENEEERERKLAEILIETGTYKSYKLTNDLINHTEGELVRMKDIYVKYMSAEF